MKYSITNAAARVWLELKGFYIALLTVIGCKRPFSFGRFNVSDDNQKLGAVASFSLLPSDERFCFVYDDENGRHHREVMGSCPSSACAGCKKACYARGIIRRSTDAALCYGENSALAYSDPDLFMERASAYFTYAAPRFFRIHVSGEFFSYAYFLQWVNIAKKFPDTVFFAYTKMSDYLSRYEAENGELPENMYVNVSIWKDTVSNPTGAPTFEYDDDTDETGETQALPHCPAILKPEPGHKKGKKREIPDPVTGEKRFFTCADCMKCARMKKGDRIAVYHH